MKRRSGADLDRADERHSYDEEELLEIGPLGSAASRIQLYKEGGDRGNWIGGETTAPQGGEKRKEQ